MPRWEVHLSFGALTTVTLSIASILGSLDGPLLGPIMERTTLFTTLFLGNAALIVGSVLPDIDGRGRIRWVIGPVMGAMLLAPFIIEWTREGGISDLLGHLWNEGSVLFLAGTLLGYLLLLLPLKHRGMMHLTRTGLLLGALWGAYIFLIASPPVLETVLIASMGTVGYCWHLALDGKLF